MAAKTKEAFAAGIGGGARLNCTKKPGNTEVSRAVTLCSYSSNMEATSLRCSMMPICCGQACSHCPQAMQSDALP
jgi:hypothetical protein